MRPSILLLAVSIALTPARVRAAPEGSSEPAPDVPTLQPAAADALVTEDEESILVPAEEPAALDVFEPGPFAIGLSGLGGAREDGRGGFVPTFSSGLDLSLTLERWVRIAARRIGYGHARTVQGDRHAVSVSPALELAIPVAERFEPFVQVGVALQARFGGEQGVAAGIAAFVSAGLRVQLEEWISIAVESALHVPATQSFLLGHEILPQGAIALQGGLGVAFHL